MGRGRSGVMKGSGKTEVALLVRLVPADVSYTILDKTESKEGGVFFPPLFTFQYFEELRSSPVRAFGTHALPFAPPM